MQPPANSSALEYKTMPSPVGNIKLLADENALVAVLWEIDDEDRIKLNQYTQNNNHPILLETERQLNEYFENKRTKFDLPINLIGTDFQKRVWELLLTIPFGKTKTYGDMARQLGDPKTVRAVGGALHRNPISIIVPCHRVIGASGGLVGFAGGLNNKALLLNLETAIKQTSLWED